ncbi:sporulation sigma-E factor-processing peptidase [Clostridium oryzae]|uniref:Sporulation sigma-E factor-processing peptidase n=2 Tax=Clostridium oryzae TaxID=1450648 RepID=A0A1V4IGH7_9CLOT|nr:sporulation sigma-E factor-processing peptidase [Clostridium oryzae]
MIIYIFVSRIVSLLMDKQKEKSYIYDVQVVSKNRTKEFKALLDTGNELKEPVTDLPVMIVAENIFSEDDYDVSKTFDIPYCSVGNSKSILKAFKPESIKIRIGNKYCCKLALIAIYNNRFTEEGEYQALLSRYMI